MNTLRNRLTVAVAAASLLIPLGGCNFIPRWWGKDKDQPIVGTEAAPTAPSATADSATRPAAAQRRPRPQVEAELRRAVTYLASDELQGRGVGTQGLDAAAEYIRNRFVSAGLRPAPTLRTYYHEFEHTTAAGISDGTTLTLTGVDQPLKLGADYTVLSSSAEGDFTGPIVFAGYGISSEAEKYNDFAGVDVKGKVCLVLRYEPQNADGKSRFSTEGWSTNAHLRNKFTACAANGASAILLVNPPHMIPRGDVLIPFAHSYQEGSSPIPVLHVTQRVAAEMLKRAGAPTLGDLQKAIDADGKPAPRDLPGATATGTVKLQRTTRTLRNVCAILPGAGPLASEYVVVGAHYDHLGYGGPGSLARGGKDVHHGADDNASGTAALLTLASHLSRNQMTTSPSTRSILFVAFTAEESGLIGSNQFVKNPPVPLDRIAAMLNMDMVGRIKEDTLYIGGAGTAEPFDTFVKSADDRSPLSFKEFGRGGFGPSDHMSFAAKKIPVLFLFSGMHPDYHRPTDTAEKINYPGLAEVVAIARDLTTNLATMPRAQYVAASDSANPHAMGSSLGGTGSRVSLGVIPDYGTDISRGGVRITGASPGSAADKAGLKDGDVIVGFGARKIGNLYDLTDALAGAKAGQTVTLRFLRDGKELTADATLTERRR